MTKTFKKSDQSFIHFEYDQFWKLTAYDPLSLLLWIGPFEFQSSWRIPYSYTFRCPLFDDVFMYTTVFHVWYHRVHFVRFLPSYIMIIFCHSVVARSTYIVSSCSMTSMNVISIFRRRLEVLIQSARWRITSFISVVILYVEILTCFQVDTNFSLSRSNTFVYPFIFWYQSGYSSNSGLCRHTLQKK